MKIRIISIFSILMAISCTCSNNKHMINSITSTNFSLQLQHTIDSLINHVDHLDSLEMSYCTIIIDSTVSNKILKVMIGQDPVYRLYKSTQDASCSNNNLKTYGGVGLKRDSNHIILMDSVTFKILKPYINDMRFVEDIYDNLKLRCYTDYIPHMWTFDLIFDSNNISGLRKYE